MTGVHLHVKAATVSMRFCARVPPDLLCNVCCCCCSLQDQGGSSKLFRLDYGFKLGLRTHDDQVGTEHWAQSD